MSYGRVEFDLHSIVAWQDSRDKDTEPKPIVIRMFKNDGHRLFSELGRDKDNAISNTYHTLWRMLYVMVKDK
jgi:hypothetical protein